MGKDSTQESQNPMELRQVQRVSQPLILYDINPDQLRMLAERAGESVFLGVASSLLTVSITLLCGFFANKPQTTTAICVYVIIIAATAIGGILAISMWLYHSLKARKARSDMVETIKRGLPPGTPVQEMEERDEGQNDHHI